MYATKFKVGPAMALPVPLCLGFPGMFYRFFQGSHCCHVRVSKIRKSELQLPRF